MRPPGQSDCSRLDQTLQSRVFDDGLDIVEAVVSLMPPAWENDRTLPVAVRDMLEYFSLYEEKNDGPAAADLQRRGRHRRPPRPARPAPDATVETAEYLWWPRRPGRSPSPTRRSCTGGVSRPAACSYVDHRTGRRMRTVEVLDDARRAPARYSELLGAARVNLDDLPAPDYYRGTTDTRRYNGDLVPAGGTWRTR